MSDLHPVSITGTIKLSDGSETSFSIEPDLGWQQWGNYTEKLRATGALVDALNETAADWLGAVDEDE